MPICTIQPSKRLTALRRIRGAAIAATVICLLVLLTALVAIHTDTIMSADQAVSVALVTTVLAAIAGTVTHRLNRALRQPTGGRAKVSIQYIHHPES